jgi:hypothetical protein
MARATGMNTTCAQYRAARTTTLTTVPVRTIRALCQRGTADTFAKAQDLPWTDYLS